MADPININFRWVSNAQKPTEGAVKQQIQTASTGFARIMVNEVAVAAAEDTYRENAVRLRRSIEAIVKAEVRRMAKSIGTHIAAQDAYKGPYGTLNINSREELSETARRANFNTQFNAQWANIRWAKRSPKYERMKKKGGPDGSWKAGYWWRKTGELQSYLRNSVNGDFYERAFGPISVQLTRVKGSQSTPERLIKTGATGKLSKTVSVGRLDVLVFNRITPAMMPGLATMNPISNPQPGLGVASLLARTYSRNRQVMKLVQKSYTYRGREEQTVPTSDVHRKLWRGKQTRKKWVKVAKGGEYRPAIDPFVSFYLTRAIPNAIWRRTEQAILRPTAYSKIR